MAIVIEKKMERKRERERERERKRERCSRYKKDVERRYTCARRNE